MFFLRHSVALLFDEIEAVFLGLMLCDTIRMVSRCAFWVLAPIIVWNSPPVVVRQYGWYVVVKTV